MVEGNYVAMEQHACTACGKLFDTDTILMNTRFRQDQHGKMQPAHPFKGRNVVTGFSTCPECKAQIAKGFVALIEIDPTKTQFNYGEHGDKAETVLPKDAYRTGNMVFLHATVAKRLFNVTVTDVMYVEPGVIAKVQEAVAEIVKMQGEEDEAQANEGAADGGGTPGASGAPTGGERTG